MDMKKKYQSKQLAACHESAQALYEIGAITEAQMREFDEECLVPEPALNASRPRQPHTPADTCSRRA
jgi:putative transcriptional regulator